MPLVPEGIRDVDPSVEFTGHMEGQSGMKLVASLH